MHISELLGSFVLQVGFFVCGFCFFFCLSSVNYAEAIH